MAVHNFEETSEALDALQVEITELLGLINARPLRREIQAAMAAQSTDIENLRGQVQTLTTQVNALAAQVDSLLTQLANQP